MAVIEKFLGQRVYIPEDRRYDLRQGIWGKPDDQGIAFGLTEPALVLMGGVNDLDWLTQSGRQVTAGEDVVFAITGKILYLSTPLSGIISYNSAVKDNPQIVKQAPYESGWLFELAVESDPQVLLQQLAEATTYLEELRHSEGCKNPQGLKGGVSGICKAVYSGIRDQRFRAQKPLSSAQQLPRKADET